MPHRPQTWIAALRPPLAALLAAVLLLACLAPALPRPARLDEGQAGSVRIAGVLVPLCLSRHDKGSAPDTSCHDGLCCLALDRPAAPPTPHLVRLVRRLAAAIPAPPSASPAPRHQSGQPRAPPLIG